MCVDPTHQRVLLVKPRYLSTWIFPGGFKSRHESAEAAAVRELREELGLDGVPLVLVGVQFQVGRRHLDVIYLAVLEETEQTLAARMELSDWEWVPFNGAEARLNEDAQRILRRAGDWLARPDERPLPRNPNAAP